MNEQALKERLKHIAEATDRTFYQVWNQLLLERILVRIAQSDYNKNLIFKGGLLLSHYISIGRETKDIDFLAELAQAEQSNIEQAFKKIAIIPISDGFVFEYSTIEKLDQPHMDYSGFRVKLNATFGKMRDKVQIDIGVGDIVSAVSESLELYHYKGKPIYEGQVSLQVYPVETIFSEKLETIISKGALNSRMKDFHDLIIMCREENLINPKKLKTNLEATFKNRGTPLKTPVEFTDNEFEPMQKLWSTHTKGLGEVLQTLQLPGHIKEVVAEINFWLEANL